jgi:hypothetical protein
MHCDVSVSRTSESLKNFFTTVEESYLERGFDTFPPIPDMHRHLRADETTMFVCENPFFIPEWMQIRIREQLSEMGRRGHIGAVESVMRQTNSDFAGAASELGRCGHIGAVESVIRQTKSDFAGAASELGRRGHIGAVESVMHQTDFDFSEAKLELGR